jgi:hypothetical protein
VTASVYRRVLGSDLDRLPAGLRAAFDEGRAVGRGAGTFDEAGTRLRWLAPLLAVMARQRVLFPEHGYRVEFEIVNRPTPDGALHATRTFRFPGRTRVLEDTFRVVDGRLHDFMGPRDELEVEMNVEVAGDVLVMRSGRQWVRLGRLRVRIPPPATVSVTESWRDGRRHIDITLRSILVGDWFRYSGGFDYSLDPSASPGS